MPTKHDHEQHGHHDHDHGQHDNHSPRAPSAPHSHHHHHHHGHHHHLSHGNAIGLALVLNLSFSIIEFAGGIYTSSTAIMADAIHDFGDAIALGFAYGFERLAKKRSNRQFSYGYRRMSLLSAVFTAIFLVISSAFVLIHTIPRLTNPQHPDLNGMAVLALVGICVNGFAAYKLLHGQTLNERVVSWHMLEDVFGWVLILISSIVMRFIDLPILDPILSLIFVVFILVGVSRTLMSTLKVFLQAVPDQLNAESIKRRIAGVAGVLGVHDLHIWSLDGANHVLTSHIVVPSNATLSDVESTKSAVREALRAPDLVPNLQSLHVTLEAEVDTHQCPDSDCGTT